MLGEVEREIFQKYKNALVAIGVDLAEESVSQGANFVQLILILRI